VPFGGRIAECRRPCSRSRMRVGSGRGGRSRGTGSRLVGRWCSIGCGGPCRRRSVLLLLVLLLVLRILLLLLLRVRGLGVRRRRWIVLLLLLRVRILCLCL
jgi:hypothetical protein